VPAAAGATAVRDNAATGEDPGGTGLGAQGVEPGMRDAAWGGNEV